MGLIDRFIGGGAAVTAVTNLAEVFRPNATRQLELEQAAVAASLSEYGGEFSTVSGDSWFDSFINGLNRLPRPVLTLGTFGLFIYSMTDPAGFSLRMEGLALVPEPLWWLLGAIISFYFGAREAHYFRSRPQIPVTPNKAAKSPVLDDFDDNKALQDWARSQARGTDGPAM